MRWDIFCKVIDNHGDIGVCWRLSAELAARGEQVRLWVDDPSALAWMAPGGRCGVDVLPWAGDAAAEPAEVVIEAFGCELDDRFAAAMARRSRGGGRPPAWFNLEYLSAEPYVERCHGLPSPVLSGPGSGLVKRFFYPGFTARTGGLLREADLGRRQAGFDRAAWLASHGITAAGATCISLFCYEPPALATLLGQLAAGPAPTHLLVTHGRAQAAVRGLLASGLAPGALSFTWLPLLSQHDYDHLLWSCDLNFVRGEDSLVRALWAGRPFVWNIYPQDDGAHRAKLHAFLDWLQAPASLRGFHEAWNGLDGRQQPELDLATWAPVAAGARERLWLAQDLASQLIGAVRETS